MYKVGDMVDVLPYSLVESNLVPDGGIPKSDWEEVYNKNPHIISEIYSYGFDNFCFGMDDNVWFWSQRQVKKSENMKLDIDLSDFV